MYKMRLAALTIFSVLALGVGESATALAAHEFVVGGKAVGKGEKVEVQGGGGIFLEATAAKTATHLRCAEGLLPAGVTNVLEELGKFKSKLELKACTATAVTAGAEEDEPKCKVPNFNLESAGELTEAGVASISGVGEKVLLATVKIEEVAGAGACSLAGTYELKGTSLCDIPDYLVTGPGIVMGCNPLGSKEVKFGLEPAKLDLSLALSGTKGQTFSSN